MFEVRRLILLKSIEAGVSPASSNKLRTENRERGASRRPAHARLLYAARLAFLVILSEVEGSLTINSPYCWNSADR